jgi:metal-responsive CopG/Arc/MetJ family transcriptional regulator
MSTITVRLGKKLTKQLDFAAKARATTRSLLVREAVATYVVEPKKKKHSFMELAGTLSSGVHDLSTNPKHMEGFGK